MEKIQQVLQSILEKIRNAITKIVNQNNSTKQLGNGNYHIYNENGRIIIQNDNEDIPINLGTPTNGIINIAGVELSIDAIEIKENQININESLTLGEDGKLYLRGKRICNDEVNDEMIRQARQNNGKFSVHVDSNTGKVIMTDPEKYRSEMYDDEARKKTEQVSKKWRENSERTRENEKENNNKNNEEHNMQDENDR